MTMTKEEIIATFQDIGALLEGHFLLRSGLHSNRYFQAARLLQYPNVAEKLCSEMAEQFKGMEIDTVISPAVGGLIVGHEVARALGVRAIFADKADNKLVMKRFTVEPGEKVLVAEDVITRGGRVQETIDLAKELGADIVGVAVIVDRSSGKAKFDVPHKSLIELELDTYEPDSCKLCDQGLELVRPGSK